MNKIRIILILFLISISLRCKEQKQEQEILKIYETRGWYIGATTDSLRAIIYHEEIPGFMKSMQMKFIVDDLKVLKSLDAGDALSFKLVRSKTRDYITNIKVLPDSVKLAVDMPVE